MKHTSVLWLSLDGGGGGGGVKFFLGQTPVKLRFKKIFPTNTCKITAKSHFFGPIPVKLRSKRFLSYHYLYKNRSKYFFLITPFGAPLLQILGLPSTGG